MARDRRRAGARRARRHPLLLPVLGLVLGLAVLAAPVAASIWADAHSAATVSEVESTWQPYDNPKVRAVVAQARKWNASCAGKPVSGTVKPWSGQLEYGGNASNCWIEIPAIGCKLPVYKGTSQETLAAGAGILEGGSLPVGGKPSNCVITAHSGMPNERMFDGVRDLKAGDKVGIHTLGLKLEYEVEAAEVVWPSETGHLRIYDRNADMVTLLTCTPYGVNDHRLLVHCKRIPWNDADFGGGSGQAAPYVDKRSAPLAAGLAIAGAAGIAIAVRRRRKKRA